MNNTFSIRAAHIRSIYSTVVILFHLICGLAVHADIADGLIAYFSFDGDILNLDCSGNNYDGTGDDRLKITPGKKGDGLRFNGDTALVVNGLNSYEWKDHLSVSLWFYVDEDEPAQGGLITAGPLNDSSWQIRLGSTEFGDGVMVGLNAENTPALWQSFPTIPMTRAAWNHMALVYDGDSAAVYWNGTVIQPSSPVIGNLAASAGPLVIGDRFAGIMDEIRIYNRVLSEDEVRYLRKEDPGRPAASCIRGVSIITNVPGDIVDHRLLEDMQLESVACRTLDRWVEMARSNKQENLEKELTSTSRRSLMWIALEELQGKGPAESGDMPPVGVDDGENKSCMVIIDKILALWKSGEALFAMAELNKYVEMKNVWEEKETP